MYKPTTLNLELKTNTRNYEIWWYNLEEEEKSGEISIHVRTKDDNESTCERFVLTSDDVCWNIDSLETLKDWFYNDFAYEYADLHNVPDDGGCTRADILYELGLYKTPCMTEKQKEDEETAFTYSVYPPENDPLYYVNVNGTKGIYCFSTFRGAEQWANEVASNLTAVETAGQFRNRPYTIFTVKPTNNKE